MPSPTLNQLIVKLQTFNLANHVTSSVSSYLSLPMIDITSVVNQYLKKPEDFLNRKTQFSSHLLSRGSHGLVDGAILSPAPVICDASNNYINNPNYHHWKRVDQQIRSLLFAIRSHDVLVEVQDLQHSYQIWEHLNYCFLTANMGRCLELKHSLINIREKENDSMDAYLRGIKAIADSLAANNNPFSDQELVQYTLFGLDHDYNNLVTAVAYFGGHLTFADL